MGFRRVLVVATVAAALLGAGCDRVLEVGRARPDASADDAAPAADAVGLDAAPSADAAPDAPATDAAIVDAG